MLRRLAMFCLTLSVAGSAVAQLSPNAPQDRPFTGDQAHTESMHRAIAPYIAQGRATYPQAKARYLAGLPAGESFYVWTTLREPPDLEEAVFIRVNSINGGIVTGSLSSDIDLLQGYHQGQILRISENDVQDWLISHPDGTEEGNAVGKFLDNYHPADRLSSLQVDPREDCSVMVQNESGKVVRVVELPSLHVATLSAQSKPFALPSDAPAGVTAVGCARESIIPLLYDYRVVAANYPLLISANGKGRLGVLEAQNGQLQFEMVDGKVTDLEQKQIQEFLDRAQILFDKEAKPKDSIHPAKQGTTGAS
jgi:hypothetical protein